jgi:hypothetical protein
MSESKYNFSVVFTSLSEIQNSSDMNEIFNVIKETSEIEVHQDFLKSFQYEDITFESIGFTRT